MPPPPPTIPPPALHVLVVEDDREIAGLISDLLVREGVGVSHAGHARQADRVLKSRHTDLVLLDIMLPEEDGFAICRRLRAQPETAGLPIIIVSALGSEAERVRGLDLGADDYLVKPFGAQELVARIRAVLRRHGSAEEKRHAAQDVLVAEGLALNLRRHALHGRDGARLALTSTELALLTIFMRHPQTVLSRDQIALRLHGRNADPLDRTIDLAVSRLRRKIEADPQAPRLIETVRNGGYLFTLPVRAEREA
jgi:two-component system OmpR family response regulator